MPFRLIPLIALLCLSSALYAQSEAPARYQIYGGYSFLSNSLDGVTGSHHPLNGWDAGIAFPSWHRLRFKIDTAGYLGSNLGAPQHPIFIMGGGQYTWRIKRESVFAEGLAGTGAANKTWAANNAQGQTASFVSLAGGGLDCDGRSGSSRAAHRDGLGGQGRQEGLQHLDRPVAAACPSSCSNSSTG